MFQACFQRIQRPRASSVSCDGFFDCLKMHPQSRPHARDVGAMASSFAARRADTVDALFAQVVERVVGVQAGEENLQIAHNYCLYHTRHHSFPDPDPRAVRDEVDALRERLGVHAQLEKQRALEMLVGRFEATPWADVDVPDVQSRVMLLLLRLSGNPLQTKYTHVAAARAVGDADATGTLRGAASVPGSGFATRARERGDRCDDDATESEDDASVRSASTLSDWSDDEETVSARADAVAAATARAARARAPRRRTNAREAWMRRTRRTNRRSMAVHTRKRRRRGSRGARWGTRWTPRTPRTRERRERRAERKRKTRRSSPRRRPRPGAAAPARPSCTRRAVCSPRSSPRAGTTSRRTRSRAPRSAGRVSPRGGTLAERAVAASRRRRTEASAVGAALHAMHGVAPADGSSGPASVPHLSPDALGAALSSAREAAASLDATRRLARATLDPNAARARRFAPPPPRRAASSRRSETRSRRFCSAPRGFSRRPREARRPSWSSGRPRASYRRARARCAPSPTRRWRRRRRSAGARRLRRVPRPSAWTRCAARRRRARPRRATTGRALWTRRVFSARRRSRTSARCTAGWTRASWRTPRASSSCASGRPPPSRPARRRTGTPDSRSAAGGWARPSAPSSSGVSRRSSSRLVKRRGSSARARPSRETPPRRAARGETGRNRA